MPLIHLSVQHGHTFDEAKRRLETTVHEFQSRFSALVQQVEWSTDRSQVRLEGIGFWIEMQVDAQDVHVSADIPVLGRLLGGSVTTRLKEIVQRTFQLKLPEGTHHRVYGHASPRGGEPAGGRGPGVTVDSPPPARHCPRARQKGMVLGRGAFQACRRCQ